MPTRGVVAEFRGQGKPLKYPQARFIEFLGAFLDAGLQDAILVLQLEMKESSLQ